MIDPIQSLAFSMHSNPGVYALLLGSGVSRAAEIPTGREIVMDLLGTLAAAAGENPETDLEQWYRDKYGDVPEYSSLLEALAKTQAERQQLLRPYFEPNEQERDQGLKQPTAAHRAIARLVSQGFVKVIVTTNFDRLIEKALDDEGVEATTLSTPEQVKGAIPLAHAKCSVFKVNGDYQDTRIRNSEEELNNYPDEHNSMLDRIFDDYGLLVCGWSAKWDGGLRDAILRAPSRRYTTHWALRGDAGDEAQRLIDHRQAQTISIENADGFFQTVQETVESIQEYSKPHPLSAEVAVASLKRYLSDPNRRIQLFDLIDSTVDRATSVTSEYGFDSQSTSTTNKELVTARMRAYESVYSTLLSMAVVGGYWAEDDHIPVWSRALERLATMPNLGGSPHLRALRAYPAVLLLYAFGLGAVERKNFALLGHIFDMKLVDRNIKSQTVSILYTIYFNGALMSQHWKGEIEGMDRNYFPMNDWLHDVLRDACAQLIPDRNKYTLAFDTLEILISAAYPRFETQYGNYGNMPGAFIYRHSNRIRILTEIRDSIADLGDDSPFVKCGIFGGSVPECTAALQELEDYISKIQVSIPITYLV